MRACYDLVVPFEGDLVHSTTPVGLKCVVMGNGGKWGSVGRRDSVRVIYIAPTTSLLPSAVDVVLETVGVVTYYVVSIHIYEGEVKRDIYDEVVFRERTVYLVYLKSLFFCKGYL